MTLFWLRLAVLLYGVAALAVLPAALYDRARWSLLAVPAAVAAAMSSCLVEGFLLSMVAALLMMAVLLMV